MGAHGAAIRRASSSEAVRPNPYARPRIALRPRSAAGNASGTPKPRISTYSAVQRPIPLWLVISAMACSGGAWRSASRSRDPSATAPDSPTR